MYCVIICCSLSPSCKRLREVDECKCARVYAGTWTPEVGCQYSLPLHSLFLDHAALGICLSPVPTHQAQFGMWNRKDVWNGLNTLGKSVRGTNGLGT